MKFDINCVRDILATIERQENPMCMLPDDFCKLLPQYSKSEIIYCCRRLNEGNYLHVYYVDVPHQLSIPEKYIRYIGDLTFDGHEFLSTIKEPGVWDKVSNIFSKGGSFSIKALGEISKELLTEYLKNKLGLK